MINLVKNSCTGCSACVNICPQKCIEMIRNNEGFLYPYLYSEKCIGCGLCHKVCPVLQKKTKEDDIKEAWGCIIKDKEVLLNSSSGGMFTALAKIILAEKGCVFGAAFENDFSTVQHVMVNDEKELAKLRGSKYIQSEMNDVFCSVKKCINEGRKVLFSGTPCQIEGLKRYLGKDADSIIFVDIICHGTPPAILWQHYLNYIENKTGRVVKEVNFRYKKKDFRIIEDDDNKLCFSQSIHRNTYMQMFLKNYCLRESCYNCTIKEKGTSSDITIGDFWGAEEIAPEIDNTLGVSLAIIHTDKGKKIFELAKESFDAIQVNYQSAIKYNSTYNNSVQRPRERDSFFLDLQRVKWVKLERKYIKRNIYSWIKQNTLFRLKKSIMKMFRTRKHHKNEKKPFVYTFMVSLESKSNINNIYGG